MRILFFDTETNGLPIARNGAISDLKNWPRVVQIAWQIWEFATVSGEVTYHRVLDQSFLVKPDPEIVWNEGSCAIHKITKERALSEGSAAHEVFTKFAEMLRSVQVVCAHNLAFDKPVALAELQRTSLDISAWPSIEYCTCINTKELLKLPSRFPKPWDMYKLPKLVELYTFLYSPAQTFEFHSASADVECLVQCFKELMRRRLVPLGTWERNLRVLEDLRATIIA